jgi:hypothetical protein
VAPRNETDVKSPAHIDCEAERIAVKPTGCQDPGTGHFAVLSTAIRSRQARACLTYT